MGVGFGILKTSGSGGGGGGTTITTVANYSALPLATAVSGKFYWCEASQGTKWLPFSVGGTYYPLGMYYSNGVTWEYSETPYQATLSEVNTGTNTDKFVSPYTFTNADKWSNYTPTSTTISTTSPLAGGGNLSANRTFSIAQANTTTDGYLSSTDWNTFNGKQNAFNGYANEIHVSALSGNDTTGNGNLLLPYASITKALSVASGGLIIVHPGTYTENPTSNVVVSIVSVNDNASKTILNGTLTIASATRVGGIRINNLVITTSGTTYIDDCDITVSFTKSGSGFVQIDNTTLQCSSGSLVSGAGVVTINGDYLYPLVVNNASANVIIKISNSCIAPNVLAGTLSIVDSILMSATPTGNAITSSAGTVVTLANTQVLVPTLDNVARVNLQGFYSIFNVIYDKPNSTLAASSGTGGTTNSIDYFQYINADKFITQGGTSSQFVKGDGTLGTSVSGTVTSVSALTISTTGTDITSTVANGTTTPTITLNVPTASATNRGALSSADWITFNSANFIPKLGATETYRGININNNSTTVISEGGVTMSSSASTTAQSVASTNFSTKQIRLRYSATVVSGGRYTGTRGSALLWFIHGGFRFICDFNISDTSYSAGCQQFYGLAGQTTDLTYGGVGGTLVSTLTNIVGIGSENGDANLSVFHNDATGTATKVDLGVGFPSNRTVGAISTTVYSIQLYNDCMSTDVKYEVKNNETGAVANGTISTNLPLTSQGLNFFASRCMSTTSVTSTGQFDLSKLGVYSLL